MLNVFYNEQQTTDADTGFSPSAKKPKLLVEQWLERKEPIAVRSDFQPVTREDYYAVHEKQHIDDVLDGKKPNGFYKMGEDAKDINRSLPWTTGSFLAAAQHAWTKKTVAMSPTSGFHHATENECMGFCSFNGLMVTAHKLLNENVSKVGILDLDHHWGNGTDSIIDYLVKRGDRQRDQFHHYTVGYDGRVVKPVGRTHNNRVVYGWQGGDATKRWLDYLPEIIAAFEGCDIVLCQAGADPHIDDPCHLMVGCEGALTNEQFLQRDEMVFSGLKSLGLPVVWNLAGGYQTPVQKVLDIHTGTLHKCVEIYGKALV